MIRRLLGTYTRHHALPVLGEAVVEHIGTVFRAGEPLVQQRDVFRHVRVEGAKALFADAEESAPPSLDSPCVRAINR